MDLLLLGGVSPHNKDWLYQVKDALAPLFGQCVVHEYAHWASAAPQIDLDHELGAIRSQIHDLKDYVIFAKSAGMVLSLKGIAADILRPRACLFVGTPLRYIHEHGHQTDVWLKDLTMPTIFAQNAHDPSGAYREVEHYLREHLRSPHHELLELPGDTHDYTNFAELYRLAAKLTS